MRKETVMPLGTWSVIAALVAAGEKGVAECQLVERERLHDKLDIRAPLEQLLAPDPEVQPSLPRGGG